MCRREQAPAPRLLLAAELSFLKHITDGVIDILNRTAIAKAPGRHIAVTENHVLARYGWRLSHYGFPRYEVAQVLRRGYSRIMATTASQNIERLTGVRA